MIASLSTGLYRKSLRFDWRVGQITEGKGGRGGSPHLWIKSSFWARGVAQTKGTMVRIARLTSRHSWDLLQLAPENHLGPEEGPGQDPIHAPYQVREGARLARVLPAAPYPESQTPRSVESRRDSFLKRKLVAKLWFWRKSLSVFCSWSNVICFGDSFIFCA